MAGHLGFNVNPGTFCNWCHDMKHAMTAKCFCMIKGKACDQPWCPVNDEYDYVNTPVPTFVVEDEVVS